MEGGTRSPERYFISQLAQSKDESINSVLTDEARLEKHYATCIVVSLCLPITHNDNNNRNGLNDNLNSNTSSNVNDELIDDNQTQMLNNNEFLFDCTLENLIAREKEMELLSRQYNLNEVWKNGSLVHEIVMQIIHDYEERGLVIPSVIKVTLSPKFESQRSALRLLNRVLAGYFRFKDKHDNSYVSNKTKACGSEDEKNIFMMAMAQCAPEACGTLLSSTDSTMSMCNNKVHRSRVSNSHPTMAVFSSRATDKARDLITALEYLRIIYAPQQLQFDNFACYLRFKLWSDYLSLRTTLTRWIYTQLVLSPSKQVHVFSIVGNVQNVGVDASDNESNLESNYDLPSSPHHTVSQQTPLLFDSDDQNDKFVVQAFFGLGNPQTEELVKVIQYDFCEFFQDNLGLTASFSLAADIDQNALVTILTIPLVASNHGKDRRPLHQIDQDADDSTVASEITYDAKNVSGWIEEEDENDRYKSTYHFSNMLKIYNHDRHQDSLATNSPNQRYKKESFVEYDNLDDKKPTSKNLDEHSSDWLRRMIHMCDWGDSLCYSGDRYDQEVASSKTNS